VPHHEPVSETEAPDVDVYFARLPDDRRAVLAELRRTVRAAAPEAVETIAYNMPALRLGGRFLVSYDSYRRHISLFPASDAVVTALGPEIEPYLAGKGTIRFPAGRPIPLDLVDRIVRIRVDEVKGGKSGENR
jgi:uncharacterized protein YdhG (YjbR/CyaY superfamily)